MRWGEWVPPEMTGLSVGSTAMTCTAAMSCGSMSQGRVMCCHAEEQTETQGSPAAGRQATQCSRACYFEAEHATRGVWQHACSPPLAWIDASACPRRGINPPGAGTYLDVGVLLLEVAPSAAHGAAGAHASNENVHLALGGTPDPAGEGADEAMPAGGS